MHSFSLLLAACGTAAAIPSDPLYFANLVDHFSPAAATYQQRYYQNLSSFSGPGAPILCIMGGEGAIPPSTGIFYPSIVLLAQRLGAAVIEPEHRYFGTSLPTAPYDTARLELLTAEQALADAAAFITYKRKELKCSGEGGEPRCPVCTVGGSYPGWLSAMMRLRYPGVVDMAYAGSAPMLFYSQLVGQYDYYRVVTESAERASPGCPGAVRSMLAQTLARASKDEIATQLNLCTPLPAYIAEGDDQVMIDEVSMVVMYTLCVLGISGARGPLVAGFYAALTPARPPSPRPLAAQT